MMEREGEEDGRFKLRKLSFFTLTYEVDDPIND